MCEESIGGILGLKADFAILDKLLQPFTGDGEEKTHSKRRQKKRAFDFESHGTLLGKLLRWTESIPVSNVRAAVPFEEQQHHF